MARGSGHVSQIRRGVVTPWRQWEPVFAGGNVRGRSARALPKDALQEPTQPFGARVIQHLRGRALFQDFAIAENDDTVGGAAQSRSHG